MLEFEDLIRYSQKKNPLYKSLTPSPPPQKKMVTLTTETSDRTESEILAQVFHPIMYLSR